MVFEGVLAQLLNRFIGDYVENLDTNQLSVGIWGGDVQLTNLVLKQSALDDLDLPVQTTYGRIGKLVLKIPWKNLYGSAIVIDVEDIYLLAAPNQEVRYNAAKEEQLHVDTKKKEIEKVDEAKRKEAEKDKPKSDYTFVEKLITQIIKNVQMNIRRIHLRYEDKVTSATPFALGITLADLNVVSTNENWIPAISDSVSKIFKIVKLDGLAVYWNCNSASYAKLPGVDLLHKMEREIASKNHIPANYSYILGPINASARLRLNQKPEQDSPAYVIPKVHLNLEMEKLFIGVSKSQYRDIIALAESMDRMSRGVPFRKFRPDVSTYRGHYAKWWKFAFDCVMESDVRRQKRNWDWNHIANHRKLCKEYGQLYQKRLRKTADKDEEAEIEKCELDLDIFNIVVIRQRIELETERLERTESTAESKSWLGWMWGKSARKEQSEINNSTEILKQFEEAMTPEEKARLYKAIDYQENASPAQYPEEYVDNSLSFLLKTLEIELIDDNSNEKRVLFTELKAVKVSLNTRATASALKIDVNIKQFNTFGLKQGNHVPLMITSETVTDGVSLLEVMFETNPIDKGCGQRLNVIAQPLRILYDAETIIKVVDVFKVPSSTALDQLAAAAGDATSNFKEMSSTGLQFAIDSHNHLDIKIDLKAPYIIIPAGGIYTGNENVFVINLGKVFIQSADRTERKDVRQMYAEGYGEKEILQQMINQSYDRFDLKLSQLQVLIADASENWKECITQSIKSTMHILLPVNLSVSASKCLITDDPRLPLLKLTGELPSLNINVSEARLLMAVSLLTGIPLPASDVPEPVPLSSSMKKDSSMMMLRYLEMQEKAKKTEHLMRTSEKKDEFHQFTTIELKFVMSELSLTIQKQPTVKDKLTDLLHLEINKMEFDLVQQTYNTKIGLRLRSINCQQFRHNKSIKLINTQKVSRHDYLLNIKFLQVDKKSPEFHSVYKSSESTLILDFDKLAVTLHREGLLEAIEFSQTLQRSIYGVASSSGIAVDRIGSTTPPSLLFPISEIPTTDSKTSKAVTKKKRRIVVETIKFKLCANLNEMALEFATDAAQLSACAIKEIKSNIIIKESYTQISASLKALEIIDLDMKCVHRKIISGSSEQAINAFVVLYNLEEDNMSNHPDISVDLTMGGLKIVFLNIFVMKMLNFLNEFQQAQTTIIEAGQAAAEKAKENMQNVYEKATKISLKIDLKAPDIIIPSNSKSYDAVLLDLGHILIDNKFITLEVEKNNPPVIDEMNMVLSALKLSRVKLAQNEQEAMQELTLLNPLNLKFTIKRNLSTSYYRAVPDLDIFGVMDTITLSLSQLDYQTIMSLISGNLSEGAPENAEPNIVAPGPDQKSMLSRSELISHSTKEDYTKLTSAELDPKVNTLCRFTFAIENIVLFLYTGGSKALSDDSPKHEPNSCLGRFSLEGLSLKGNMLSDNSIITSFLLVNCLLDDLRVNRTSKLTRLIERSTSDPTSMSSLKPVTSSSVEQMQNAPRSMIDVLVQMKDNDMFIDVKIYSFTVILSVDYLMKIAGFFSTQQAQSAQPVPAAVATVDVKRSKTKIKMVEQEPKPGQTTLNLKVEKPDIVLVEHMDDIDTQALIWNNEILIKLRMAGTHQVINGTIKDFQLYTCTYNPSKRAETRCDVLAPVTISLAGSTPEDRGLNVELLITKLALSVSPATISLLSSVMATATATETVDASYQPDLSDHTTLWDVQTYAENNYWFFKGDEAIEATEQLNLDEIGTTPKLELCIVSIPEIVLTLEAGIGNKTLPMLILESSIKATVKNWSSQMAVEASLSLSMGYYNATLALWEPLIELVEVVRKGEVALVPWELKLDVAMSGGEEEVSSPVVEHSMDVEIVQQMPAMSIDVSSEATLELAVTKTCLEVLNNLGKAFASAMKVGEVKAGDGAQAPYRVVNELGLVVKVNCGDEGGAFVLFGDDRLVDVMLEDRAQVALQLSEKEGEVQRYLTIDAKDCLLNLPVTRADKRYFPLNFRSENNDMWGLVSDVKISEGVTIVTLRSILQVYNHFNVPIEIFYMTTRGNELESIAQIAPETAFNVPLAAVYTQTKELFFSVENYSVTSIPYVWKDLVSDVIKCSTLKCVPKNGTSEQPFIISTMGEMEQIYFENTSRHTMISTCYNIHLRPPVTYRNCLPIDIVLCIENMPGDILVKPGDVILLPNVEPGKSCIIIRLPEYLEKEWSTRQEVHSAPNEFYVWTFYSYDSTKLALNLGMHIVNTNGTHAMKLYCPFWMLNKTGLSLSYRNSDDALNVLHHPADFKGPILFSFNVKNFFGKKKAAIKIEKGDWSDKFSLDVAGSSGVVVCKFDRIIYQVGVHNQLTYNGLTKQITFTPRYVIINNAPFPIECQENDRPADPWLKVAPDSCLALWPNSDLDDKLLRLRVEGTNEVSAPFMYTESHVTLLKLKNKYGGINVDTQLTEGGSYISLAAYVEGMAPALIINHTRDTMSFWEKESVQLRKLPAHNQMLYTWENPSGPRSLAWDIGNKKELNCELKHDVAGEYEVQENYHIYWVSFLNGMQRVLLFTETQEVLMNAQASKVFEVIDREITVSIHGVGLSLVNNHTMQEIMYMGIASSGIIWEQAKHGAKRFKQMGGRESAAIEAAYQRFLIEKNEFNPYKPENSDPSSYRGDSRYIVDAKTEVDFVLNQMLKPHKRRIRRSFQTGFWAQLKTSPNLLQLHAKVNRLQIDNQLHDCIFPVVLAPVPLPKSVAIDSGMKPFAELSIVEMLTKNSQVKQFKYFKVLVQEFHVKVDLGFINALWEVLATSEYSEQEEKELFLTDVGLVDEPLFAHVSTQSIQEQKSFYDLLHFSPLKIHVSFSMASGSNGQSSVATPNFLNVLLQGIGVTLTDLQDVVFKLAYFERKFTFLTQKQLISETTKHYVGQSVKQLYVLVLGLDVLGNPYGLVIGITKGVEDFFYEPFQGAIQGPGEFAEGIILGVRSLFGHTVGGAAGAVSRITGAMGKGIAVLTFDEDYQRKRRDQINKKPATVQEGIARSGKGLVMGVFDGVTGVFTKPISGAREEGVGGFFKGLGKGAVGLVARPTAGVVDFASGSLDAVKRVTEVGEDANRLRPPRFLHSDGQLRPYMRIEAEGNKLLKELEKGKYARTDYYAAHYTIIEKKAILLLTDKRIAFISHNDLFGSWAVDWSYTWNEMKHPPEVVPKGVQLAVYDAKKKSRFFGGNDTGKIIVQIVDSAKKEEICAKIESLRGGV